MRPCNQCGTAVGNDQLLCKLCQRELEEGIEYLDESGAPKRRHRVTVYVFVLGIYEAILTGLIIGMPAGVVCTLVALFFFPNWYAVGYGFLAGFITGIVFWLLRTFFLVQAVRKPLR